MTITYIQREVLEKVWVRATSITSNFECAHCYGIITPLKVTIVDSKHGLINSGKFQEWYITDDYILGKDGATKNIHSIQRKVKFVPMTQKSPEPQPRNKKSQ